MKIYVFGNYMDFKCLAGNCQTTCCSGWKIVVDREAYERFKNLENKSLRADILSNIVEKDDVHSFKNRTNGDCAMLDGDGLCRIQRNSNEKTLCNTCRKYPRLSFSDKDTMLLSMAASCPVIIEYLSNDKIKNMWYEMGTDKKMYPIDISGVNWFAQDKNRFDILINDIKTKYYLKSERLSELFFDFADMAVDIIISCKDCMYFDGSFDAYEEQMQGEEFRRRYNDFTKKYLLDYFSQVEEPTLILLFGDHQPQVATNFYTDVLGTAPDTALAQKKQMVPFVLWANYDIPEAQGVELSLNYLSALLMDTANLPMTGYQKYLARLWEAAPVINTVGIRDAGGNWYGENEALPEELEAAVEDYRVLLYNHVFDKKNRVEGFFTLTE